MSNLKYFPTRESGLRGFELFVHIDLLLLILKIPKKTVLNGLQKNRLSISSFYCHLEYPDGIYVNYDSLPRNAILRHGLPANGKLAFEFLENDKQCQLVFFKNEGARILFENMKKFYLDKWPMFVSHYVDEFDDKSKRQRYAQCHALISFVIDHEKQGITRKNLFEHFKKLVYEELSRGYRAVFSTENYWSFSRKIREAKPPGTIKNALLHKSKGVKRQDLAILSDADRDWIKAKKADPANYPYRAIQDMLHKERGVYVDVETLKTAFRNKLTRNIVRQFSKGSSYSRKNRLPTIRRVFQFPGDQYQADGSKLQFVCIDHTNKIITLTFYVVLDAYSRKVVGLSIDVSENTNMIMQAFKYAFISVKHLPREIVVDNGPCYRSKEFKKFISNLQHFGVVWTPCPPDYPLAKAEVESFFSVFQKVICTKYPYYVGEGIKSKNEYGNPAEDLIKKYRKHKHLLMSRKDLSLMLVKMIKEYNDEYYKESIERVNAVPGTLEEKYASSDAVYDIETVLA